MTEVNLGALPPNSIIAEKYIVQKVLGEGGFGITYLVVNHTIQKQFAIKEYLPQDQAIRDTQTQQIIPRTNRKEDFQYGLKQFLKEAEHLARFEHPNIVGVFDFIESNGTAYLIMRYEAGQELSARLKKSPPLSEAEIVQIIRDILTGLKQIHQQKMLHRDIKPSNIYLRQNGEALLIDFGSSRYALGAQSKSLSAIITPGYAPPEQYSSKRQQAAQTDLYAVGATLYKMLTGKAPVEASERREATAEGDADPYISAIKKGLPNYSPWLKELTDQLLELSFKTRPNDSQAVLNALAKQKPLGWVEPSIEDKTKIVKEEGRWAKKPSSKAKTKPRPKGTLDIEQKVIEKPVQQQKTRLVDEKDRWEKEPVQKKSDGKRLIIAVGLVVLCVSYWFYYWFYSMPDEAEHAKRYQIYNNGTVKDTKTGLIWKRCSEGQSGADCSQGEAKKYTWQQAMDHAKQVRFAGHSDWRLPTLDELHSLVYCSNGVRKPSWYDDDCDNFWNMKEYQSPTINQIIFPHTESSFYWSASSSVPFPNTDAGFVYFSYGGTGKSSFKSDNHLVRLVRGGQSL